MTGAGRPSSRLDDGLVGCLHHRHVPRLVAVGVVFVGFIACLILLLVASSSE